MPARTAVFKAKLAIFDARVKTLYLVKFSTYAIAERLGCSQGKVGRSLRRTRTPRRSKSEANYARYGSTA